ncbi:MAG: hypothetical protein ABJA34_12065 [Pseudonocardiales bacterium]
MPAGSYLHTDGVTEDFHCAAGPSGWRYVSTACDGGRIDLTVDSRWHQIRVEIAGGGWLLRGGVSGAETVWLRSAADDLSQASEHSARAAGFAGRSPGLFVATARSLRLAVGGSARVRLVAVTGRVLATVLIDQEWTLTATDSHATDTGPLPVEHYQIADLATGATESLHISADVALSGPGTELHDLQSPPTL